MAQFVCPRSTRETDGIAAKLLRCGIASEALRRNMPLSMEMNGGSSASYLARIRRIPDFVLCLVGVETEGLLDYQGRPRRISIVP